jgi:uncharacterized caspase-like protein
MNRRLIYLMLTLALVGLPARAQERCGTAKDSVVQAREKARPGLRHEELEESYQQLKRANGFCPAMGDAYYYRYLYARQLGNTRDADYALRKAKENGSEALNYEDNPFAAPVAGASLAVSSTIREKWALVVGISQFQSRNRIPSLQFPAKDARDFATWLVDPRYGHFKPENVRLLTDSQATTQRIKENLNLIARNAQKDDLVVIFVSSHGSPRELDTGGISYVITYDTEASSQDSLYATALAMVDITDALATRIKAQRGVLFLDTCFSGAIASGFQRSQSQGDDSRTEEANRNYANAVGGKALVAEGAGIANVSLERLRYSIGRVVITASQPNERSWESERLKNGYFTYYLIAGLKQNNGKGSMEELYHYLKAEVSKSVRAEKNVSQLPMMLPAKPTVDIRLGADTSSH